MRTEIGLGIVALAFVAVPVVTAQSPQDELLGRAQEKAGEAQEDPVGFVHDHASPQGAQREANWTVSFACRTVDEAGVPPPDLEQCRGRDEAVGVEADERVEPSEGIADEDVRDLLDEAFASAEELLEEPTDALSVVQRFLEYLVDFVEDLLDGLSGTVRDAFQVASEPVRDGLGHASHAAASVADLAEGATNAVESGLAGVGHAIDSAVDGVASQVSSWFGKDPEPRIEARPQGLPDDEELPDADLLDGLPCVDCVLEEAA